MKKGFCTKHYFINHPEIGDYTSFCVWCRGHDIRVKKLDNEEDVKNAVSAWENYKENKEPKFKSRRWFLKHYSEIEYSRFYTYCHYTVNVSFKDITSLEQLQPLVLEWKKYEKEKNENKPFSVKREFAKHPEYGNVSRFYNWHVKTYKEGTKGLSEEEIRKRIKRYVRYESQR